MLIAVLLQFFAASVRVDRKIDLARQRLYHYENLSIRLHSLLGGIVLRSELPDSPESSLYTLQEEKQSLTAIFDNGIDPDPIFSGPIRAKLFLDAQDLYLDLSPLEKMDPVPHRKELLFSGVTAIAFQFLAKKNSQDLDPQAAPIGNAFEWRTNWPKNRWDIPSLIRFTLTTKEGSKGFAFFLPFFEPSIVYEADA